MLLKTVFGSALLLSSSVMAAQQCEIKEQGLEYAFSQVAESEPSEFKHVMNVWRMPQQVAHQYLNSHITEMWHQIDAKKIKLTRYFDSEQRAIEYQPNEVAYTNIAEHWQKMQHMISKEQLANMTLLNVAGSGCNRIETYLLKAPSQQLTVEWLPDKKLMNSSTSIANGVKSQWKLIKVIDDTVRVASEFTLRDNYQSTDYADIGDNESDPFLVKMITLGHIDHGASGFYDEQGHSISSHHTAH